MAPGNTHSQLLLELIASRFVEAGATFAVGGYQGAVAVMRFVCQDGGSG